MLNNSQRTSSQSSNSSSTSNNYTKRNKKTTNTNTNSNHVNISDFNTCQGNAIIHRSVYELNETGLSKDILDNIQFHFDGIINNYKTNIISQISAKKILLLYHQIYYNKSINLSIIHSIKYIESILYQVSQIINKYDSITSIYLLYLLYILCFNDKGVYHNNLNIPMDLLLSLLNIILSNNSSITDQNINQNITNQSSFRQKRKRNLNNTIESNNIIHNDSNDNVIDVLSFLQSLFPSLTMFLLSNQDISNNLSIISSINQLLATLIVSRIMISKSQVITSHNNEIVTNITIDSTNECISLSSLSDYQYILLLPNNNYNSATSQTNYLYDNNYIYEILNDITNLSFDLIELSMKTNNISDNNLTIQLNRLFHLLCLVEVASYKCIEIQDKMISNNENSSFIKSLLTIYLNLLELFQYNILDHSNCNAINKIETTLLSPDIDTTMTNCTPSTQESNASSTLDNKTNDMNNYLVNFYYDSLKTKSLISELQLIQLPVDKVIQTKLTNNNSDTQADSQIGNEYDNYMQEKVDSEINLTNVFNTFSKLVIFQTYVSMYDIWSTMLRTLINITNNHYAISEYVYNNSNHLESFVQFVNNCQCIRLSNRMIDNVMSNEAAMTASETASIRSIFDMELYTIILISNISEIYPICVSKLKIDTKDFQLSFLRSLLDIINQETSLLLNDLNSSDHLFNKSISPYKNIDSSINKEDESKLKIYESTNNTTPVKSTNTSDEQLPIAEIILSTHCILLVKTILSTNTIDVSNLQHIDHLILRLLPRNTWWLFIRILKAFLVIQKSTGVMLQDQILPVITAINYFDSKNIELSKFTNVVSTTSITVENSTERTTVEHSGNQIIEDIKNTSDSNSDWLFEIKPVETKYAKFSKRISYFSSSQNSDDSASLKDGINETCDNNTINLSSNDSYSRSSNSNQSSQSDSLNPFHLMTTTIFPRTYSKLKGL